MQQWFRLFTFAGMMAILFAVVGAHALLLTLNDRVELGPRSADVEFEPVHFDSEAFAPMALIGAWKLTSRDPRVTGLSALAFDNGTLMALSDSGTIVRFPKPVGGHSAGFVRELPDGPGDPRQKINRDSESLVRDPAGRGWWVAFETRDELWLYNNVFTRPLRRVAIPNQKLRRNRGIEGMTSAGPDLLLLPENRGPLMRLSNRKWSEIPFDFDRKRSSDVAALGNGSLVMIERRVSAFGIANALVGVKPCKSGFCLEWRKELPLGFFDNVEGIAVEQTDSGRTRLWLVSDDDSAPPRRTLLIELELPSQN